MAYELLVCDIDGTLLTSKDVITPKTKAALLRIQENGQEKQSADHEL